MPCPLWKLSTCLTSYHEIGNKSGSTQKNFICLLANNKYIN